MTAKPSLTLTQDPVDLVDELSLTAGVLQVQNVSPDFVSLCTVVPRNAAAAVDLTDSAAVAALMAAGGFVLRPRRDPWTITLNAGDVLYAWSSGYVPARVVVADSS